MTGRKKPERRPSAAELDKKYLWHPFTRMREWEKSDPLVIERGKGNYLIDENGRRYLDGVSSLWVNLHGHGKREIDAAISRQLKKIAHSTLLGLANVPSSLLAERLVKIAPRGLTKVFYSDNGSTAVEIAMKMAFNRHKGKRKTFLAFTGAYHGDTVGGMSVGEIDAFVKRYRPLLFETLRAPYPYCYRCPVGKEKDSCSMECVSALEALLKRRGKEITACIIEPIVEGAAGMITSPPGFLKEVRRLTKKYGVLLIADEVATGFGRTGEMFACDTEGVSPDLMCLAKGITGGYLPLAATLSTDEIYAAFLGTDARPDAFYHGHTYTGNQLGCAAAIANLDVFEKEKVLDKIQPKIKLFKELLEGFYEFNAVGDVRSAGLMAGIELVKDKKTKRPFEARLRIGERVCAEARRRGLIIRPLGDTIVIMPPLSIKEAEIRKMAGIVEKILRELTV